MTKACFSWAPKRAGSSFSTATAALAAGSARAIRIEVKRTPTCSTTCNCTSTTPQTQPRWRPPRRQPTRRRAVLLQAGGDGVAAQAACVVSASGRGALAGAVGALPNLPAGLAQWFQQHQQHPQPTGGPGANPPACSPRPARPGRARRWSARRQRSRALEQLRGVASARDLGHGRAVRRAAAPREPHSGQPGPAPFFSATPGAPAAAPTALQQHPAAAPPTQQQQQDYLQQLEQQHQLPAPPATTPRTEQLCQTRALEPRQLPRCRGYARAKLRPSAAAF